MKISSLVESLHVNTTQIGDYLNESWWADSMECYTYLRNVTDLLSHGKTPYERRPFKGPMFPFGSLVEYHPITAKDQSRIHQFGKKVLPGLFLGYALYAGRIWKGDVLIANLEELETTAVTGAKPGICEEGGGDVIRRDSLFAELRKFCMAIRLSSSVCISMCKKWKEKKTGKDRSKWRVRESNSK